MSLRQILMAFHGASERIPNELSTISILSFGPPGSGLDISYSNEKNGILFGTNGTPATQEEIEGCMPFQVAAFETSGIYTSVSNWSFVAVDPTNGSRVIDSISDLNTVVYSGKTYYCVYLPNASTTTHNCACMISNQVSAISKTFSVFWD